jgi:hypothetical protein
MAFLLLIKKKILPSLFRSLLARRDAFAIYPPEREATKRSNKKAF